MSYSASPDPQFDSLLAAVTDAILADEHDVETIVARYHVPRDQFEGALYLIHRLTDALVMVNPSKRYVRQLRADLIGHTPTYGLVSRVRYLPPRVQIAAGLTLLAGVAFLLRRRMTVESPTDTVEIPVLQ